MSEHSELAPEITSVDDNEQWQVASSKNQSKSKIKNQKKKKTPLAEAPQPPPINDIYNADNVQLVKDYVSRNEKIMIILRGCPGSGKSTLANQIQFNGIIVSADTYFINEKGVYNYNPLKLTDAHLYCRAKINESLKNKISPIIVDNTNLKGWEFKAYASTAIQNNYHVELMEPNTPWKYKASHLATKNIHSVPLNKIQKLLIDFDKNINVKALTGLEGLPKPLPKIKPGNFIKNFDDYFANNEWATEEIQIDNKTNNTEAFITQVSSRKNSSSSDDNDANNPIPAEIQPPKPNLWNIIPEIDPSVDHDNNEITNNKIEGQVDDKFNESKELLKAMFSDVDEEILIEFLNKYNNDVTVVTNILLDSLNFGDVKSKSNEAPSSSAKEEDEEYEIYKDIETSDSHSIETLKNLCIKEMYKLDGSNPSDYNQETSSSLATNHNESRLSNSNFLSFQDDNIPNYNNNSSQINNELTEDLLRSISGDNEIFNDNINEQANLFTKNLESKTKKSKFSKDKSNDKINFKDCYSKNKKTFPYKPCFVQLDTKEDYFIIPQNETKPAKPYNCKRKNRNNNESGNNMKSDIESKMSTSPPSSISSLATNNNCSMSETSSVSNDFNGIVKENNDDGDEPILKLGLTQDFLSSLIQLFGDSTDEMLMEDNQNIEIGIKMAYQLYLGWKRTNNSINRSNGNQRLYSTDISSQIEKDEKLSQQLFDQINMRDPVEKQPVYLSDKGINSAQSSLRQIMAEEMAEQIRQERMPKKIQTLTPSTDFTKFLNDDTKPSKFDIKNVQIKNKPDVRKTDYYNTEIPGVCAEDENNYMNEYRSMANKYYNLRTDYFRKAGEAFKRGSGGVAQYYAEKGHEQTMNMQYNNEIASIQTFVGNNPDIQHSNTLDLHGLQVKEALKALKEVMTEKKIEMQSSNGKRIKTYLFVITGFGHNSENGPRLRPNIINYLNQSGIRYREPNIGLLKVDLVNN